MTLPIYPWRQENAFELAVDGEHFFPKILDAIAQARSTICIELYLVESGRATALTVEALVAAARRGVRVRCLFDDVGSHDFVEEERERLRQGGVDLRFYNPLRLKRGLRNFHRDHRKILVFDERLAMTGGFGLSDPFCVADSSGGTLWHDQMLAVTGPVVKDWQALFDQAWSRADGPRTMRPRLGPSGRNVQC